MNNLIDVRRDRHDARAEGALHFRGRGGVPAAPRERRRPFHTFRIADREHVQRLQELLLPFPDARRAVVPDTFWYCAAPPRAAFFMGCLRLFY